MLKVIKHNKKLYIKMSEFTTVEDYEYIDITIVYSQSEDNNKIIWNFNNQSLFQTASSKDRKITIKKLFIS